MPEARRFFAPQAWVQGGWQRDVLLVAGADGSWQEVRAGAQPDGAEVLAGPVLPGLVNGHSHAFQRAIAGLTERSAAGHDDFWSWRDRMYAAALRISPEQLEAIATQLYGELLAAGYTQVCEFHYLHNAVDGRPYADPAEMSLALVRAAQRAGIGLTLLPTLYMRSGFGAAGLREDQRRFASTPESVLRIAQAVRAQASPLVTAGIALHSLRAVDAAALRECADAARAAGMPVHIHVAEQQQEVDDCVQAHGVRPIEWLLRNAKLDARWNLVHATQSTRAELEGVQGMGAAIVLCPSTEANLGDGVFDLPSWLAVRGAWSIGSDSHVTRSWSEELRLLEYSQRLALRQRNVAARAGRAESTAAVLFEGALAGGSAACGVTTGGLAVGQRADLCVVDTHAPALAGLPADHLLDALVFSSPAASMLRVVVAGKDVAAKPDSAGFVQAMRALW
ncbi:formimidoylglutamate deiminase [Ramlibacter sp. USB13]|uniref:Formimidoylglutamate deiminase n=1 Tax=Ramlibacter cellulosilyticus TaxID=2764187 RepID=A0A923SBI6_9BURK|nr:formimidoylglutamate deiminase [Ramlibacter cellulosilyticus]MBC5783910.1 formimidoylglutamate deiminase [Ramlibacter cellulosilyticus]